MAFWKWLFGKKAQHHGNAKVTGPTTCPQCGKALTAELSGQIASFLGLDAWPCPKCDIGASALMVSERGIAAENHQFCITVQRTQQGGFKTLVGHGSIASPASRALPLTLATGAATLQWMRTALCSKDLAMLENFHYWTKQDNTT